MLTSSATSSDQENQENVPPGTKGAPHLGAGPANRTVLGLLRDNQHRLAQPQVRRPGRVGRRLAACRSLPSPRAGVLARPTPAILEAGVFPKASLFLPVFCLRVRNEGCATSAAHLSKLEGKEPWFAEEEAVGQ